MANNFDVFGFGTTMVIFVPAGFSNAVLINPQAYETASLLKFSAGGSMEIMGATVGGTYPMQSAAGQGYLMDLGEVVNISGPARYYLCATGSTGTCYLLRAMGAQS